MSIPNEALQKLVNEIELQARTSQQQIAAVKAQIAAKQRNMRLVQLTSTELSSLPNQTNVYDTVGRMFVLSPKPVMNKRLASEVATSKTEITNLEKKLHYLETTYKNSREHIDQILKRSGR